MLNSKSLNLYQISDSLGFLEKKILYLIAQKNICKPRDILDILKRQNKNYAYTTIMTVMDKLYKKDYLTRQKIGKTYFYQLKIDLKILEKRSLVSILDNLIKKTTLLNFLNIIFYLLLLKPILVFFNIPLIKGISLTVLLTFIGFFISDFTFNIYSNGFLDYLTLLLKEPHLLVNFFYLNFSYLIESFSSLTLVFMGIFLIKKMNRYQFNPN